MINWITNKLRRIIFGIENEETHPGIPENDLSPSESGSVPAKDSARPVSRPRRTKPVERKQNKRVLWDVSEFDVPPADDKTRFHDLKLTSTIMHAIADLGFQYCTPIQAEILPKTLLGKDATGQAQTGTGKSAAFLVTIYTRILKNPIQGKRRPGTPRALILAPTRELVLQIEKDAMDLGKYTRSRPTAVFGGMAYEKQKKILQKKIVDIVMATPGRLLDFQRQKIIDLSRVEILVIDEADRMLDMGFIPDIRRIVRSTPHKTKRQTMFFSATLTPEVMRLSSQWTKDPFSVEIEPETVAAENINQIVYIVTAEEKFSLLYNLIKKLECVLVFTNRRDQARDLEDRLKRQQISCALLSGEVAQNKRLRVLDGFKSGKFNVLVATDVAARGIHVDGISHVVNYNLPQNAEHYVHRIGRTGRAGSSGTSISFACEDESFYIPDIEEFLGEKMNCEHPEDDLLTRPPKPLKKAHKPGPKTKKNYAGKKTGKRYPAGTSKRRPPKHSRSRSKPRSPQRRSDKPRGLA